MLESKKKWTFAADPVSTPEWELPGQHVTPIVKKLLLQRGIDNEDAALRFLKPNLQDLHAPAQFADIDKASERVHQAIRDGEKILVYGDYDADGVTSTTVMLETLEELGAYCDFYIPNRFTEGYGPNEAAFRAAHDAGATLIITVDNGISGVHEAMVAKELGVDLIITDHHEVQATVPAAYAVLHPKCSPDYPFKELAGVGVAFKFAEKLLGYFPDKFLDLVAIGTIADLVPLVDENRILVRAGLDKLTNTERPGLQAIKELAKIEGSVDEEDVGFLIGPRLNAVGRLQDADLAVELLRAEDMDEARELAGQVQDLNQERQKIVADIAKEAEAMIRATYESIPGVIIVSKAGWNEGVLGIVASKLVRTFGHPAIVLAEKENGLLKGSARSIPSFDLFTACMEVRDLFESFGGHAQAAGMTFKPENREAIAKHLDQIIYGQLNEADFKEELFIAGDISLDDANEQLVRELYELRPFGMHNPKPVFHFKDIPKEKRLLGSLNKHLKLNFSVGKQALEGIGFGMGNLSPAISDQVPVSIVGELGINEWNGFRKMQLVMKDLRIDAWQLFDYRGKQTSTIPKPLPDERSMAIGPPSLLAAQFTEQGAYADIAAMEPIDSLYLFELPDQLETLTAVINQTVPKKIYACFQMEESAFLSGFPSREAFIWLYGYILKKGEVSLKAELPMLMQQKGWTKDWIVFMTSVFQDLEFISVENSVIRALPKPDKKPLDTSIVYQNRQKRMEIEKTLYYATSAELKKWLASHSVLGNGQAEKELAHGL